MGRQQDPRYSIVLCFVSDFEDEYLEEILMMPFPTPPPITAEDEFALDNIIEGLGIDDDLTK